MSQESNAPLLDPAILMARQSLYRFAALSLLDPKAGSWQRIHDLCGEPILSEAASIIRNLNAAHLGDLGPGERRLSELVPAEILTRLPENSAKLNEQFESTFGLLVSKACPPHETDYIDSKLSFQRSNTLADVSGFYRAFGLITSTAHPERPDHIVQELEFMAFLISLQRQAMERNTSNCREEWEVCHNAQVRFLSEHLSWWAPAFAKLLCREAAGGFYEAAGKFLASLIPAERALLEVTPAERLVTSTWPEAPEECEGCELAH